jgi:DNA-binding transcriptional MerR regulator
VSTCSVREKDQCFGEDDPEMGYLGILPAKRTITNRRYYTDEDLALALGLPRLRRDCRTAAYRRVSSMLDQRQCLLLAGSLKKRSEALEWRGALIDGFLQARARLGRQRKCGFALPIL